MRKYRHYNNAMQTNDVFSRVNKIFTFWSTENGQTFSVLHIVTKKWIGLVLSLVQRNMIIGCCSNYRTATRCFLASDFTLRAYATNAKQQSANEVYLEILYPSITIPSVAGSFLNVPLTRFLTYAERMWAGK